MGGPGGGGGGDKKNKTEVGGVGVGGGALGTRDYARGSALYKSVKCSLSSAKTLKRYCLEKVAEAGGTRILSSLQHVT